MTLLAFVRRLLAAAMLWSTVSAHAGIPVVDVGAITQAIAQVRAWGQQYNQMITSIQHAKDQLDAIRGGRGLGQLLNDPSVRNSLDADFVSTFDKLRSSGSGGASASANNIYKAISSFDCAKRVGTSEVKLCEASALATPSMVALMNDSIEKSRQRTTEINKLISAIDGAPDTKAAADLQNRIGSELALLSNEKTMMDMALSQMQAQRALLVQQRAEEGAKRLRSNSTNPFNME